MGEIKCGQIIQYRGLLVQRVTLQPFSKADTIHTSIQLLDLMHGKYYPSCDTML
jgi:hypothetical protein